jgi:hypothetical protein
VKLFIGAVYTSEPATLHDLKECIIERAENITGDLPHLVMFSFRDGLQKCLQCNGEHKNAYIGFKVFTAVTKKNVAAFIQMHNFQEISEWF